MIGSLTASRDYSDSGDEDDEREIHLGVQCDGCGQCPLIGERYKCKVCDNYDLCGKCKTDGVEVVNTRHSGDHSMRRIEVAKSKNFSNFFEIMDGGKPQPSTSRQPSGRGLESSGTQSLSQNEPRAGPSVRPRDPQLRPRADSNPQYEVGI